MRSAIHRAARRSRSSPGLRASPWPKIPKPNRGATRAQSQLDHRRDRLRQLPHARQLEDERRQGRAKASITPERGSRSRDGTSLLPAISATAVRGESPASARSCHVNPHQKRMSGRCESCHSSRRWDDIEAFEIHRRTRFPLTGMHALAACTECHLTQQREAMDDGSERLLLLPCVGLSGSQHSSESPRHRNFASFPRTARNVTGSRRGVRRSSIRAPLRAQRPALVSTGLGGMVVPADHDRLFPVSRGPHRGAPCNSCHTSARTPRLVRCTGCHAHNPVKLQQQHGRRVSSSGVSCLGCHPGGTAR